MIDLKSILTQHPNCLNSRASFKSVLMDKYPKEKRTVNILTILFECGVANKIKQRKHIDENEHIELTGKTGKNIRQMLEYLSEKNKPVWIRHVLVPGITDNDEYLIKTRDYIRTLKNVQRVEVLPYHSFGIYKWKELNLEYKLDDVEQPTKERVQNAQAILEIEKYDGYKK